MSLADLRGHFANVSHARTVLTTPLVLILGTGGLAACEGPLEEDTTLSAAGPNSIELAQTQADLEAGVLVDNFNLAQTRDVWVRLKLSQMAYVVLADARFTGPDGALFRTERNAFSPDPNVIGVDLGNGQAPLPVRTVYRVPGSNNLWALDFPVSVGGTDFTRLSQGGTWSLQFTLSDRGSTPQRTFTTEALQ